VLLVARQLAVDVRARHRRGVRQLSPHQLGQAATFLAIAADPAAATGRYENAADTVKCRSSGNRTGSPRCG
jgi:hypothetical protein